MRALSNDSAHSEERICFEQDQERSRPSGGRNRSICADLSQCDAHGEEWRLQDAQW